MHSQSKKPRKTNRRGEVLLSQMAIRPELEAYIRNQAKDRNLSMGMVVSEAVELHKLKTEGKQ
jgi:hypothetical protein